MIIHTAELLFPIASAPIRDAAVLVDDDGVIVRVGRGSEIIDSASRRVDHQILMPGVVNAHTHLTDAEIETPIPGGSGLAPWVGGLMMHRLSARAGDEDGSRRFSGPHQSVLLSAVADVLRRMSDAGTVAIGEVCNGMATLDAIRESGMRCRFIQEILAFPVSRVDQAIETARRAEAEGEWSESVRPAFGAHAPYSVSPELMERIVTENRARHRMTYIHLAEDPAERELYVEGDGPWEGYLRLAGAWEPSWKALGKTPIELYAERGILGPWLAAVHLADATESEIAMLARAGVRAILSPASNRHIGGRLPNAPALVSSGMTLAFGTDGRGSNPSIDVFDEARILLEHYPWLDPVALLIALTQGGAEVIGFPELGAIEVGRHPGLVSAEIASLPDDTAEAVRKLIVEPLKREAVGR